MNTPLYTRLLITAEYISANGKDGKENTIFQQASCRGSKPFLAQFYNNMYIKAGLQIEAGGSVGYGEEVAAELEAKGRGDE